MLYDKNIYFNLKNIYLGYVIGAPGQFYPSSNPPQYVQQTPALPESRVEPSSNGNLSKILPQDQRCPIGPY